MLSMRRLAIWLTFLMGFINGWRTVALLQERDVLLRYGTRYSLTLIITMSIIWTVVFFALGAIGRRRPRAVWLPIPFAFLLYTLYNVWLPTPTVPFLYWHLFLLIFTGVALGIGGRKKRELPTSPVG